MCIGKKTKLDKIGPRDEVRIGGQRVGLRGPRGPRGGPTGSQGVKGWAYRVQGCQGVGLQVSGN